MENEMSNFVEKKLRKAFALEYQLSLDVLVYGNSFYIVDKNGNKTRIDPLDVLPKEMIADIKGDETRDLNTYELFNRMKEAAKSAGVDMNTGRPLKPMTATEINDRNNEWLYSCKEVKARRDELLKAANPMFIINPPLMNFEVSQSDWNISPEPENPDITVHESCSAFSHQDSDYLADRFDVSRLVNNE
jgi:hypothetical protein